MTNEGILFRLRIFDTLIVIQPIGASLLTTVSNLDKGPMNLHVIPRMCTEKRLVSAWVDLRLVRPEDCLHDVDVHLPHSGLTQDQF